MKKFYSFFTLLMLSLCAFAADVVIEPVNGEIVVSATDVEGIEDDSELIISYSITGASGTINVTYPSGQLAVAQIWVLTGTTETTVTLTNALLNGIRTNEEIIISASGATLTKATIKNNETDVTGDVVGNYYAKFVSSRSSYIKPVTIEKKTNKVVTVKGLGSVDFDAKVTSAGLFVENQSVDETVVSGRTLSTWVSTYDEETQQWSGGWNYTYQDSTTFYIKDGYYSLVEGIQFKDTKSTYQITDGILFKEGTTLPGESYDIVMDAYENTGFDVEKMQPIMTYSTLTDNANIIINGSDVTILGAFGHSEFEGSLAEDGSIVFPYDGMYFYGPWDSEAMSYGPITLNATDNGYSAEFDASSYAYFITSYLTKVTFTKGATYPADKLVGSYSLEYVPSNKYNGAGNVQTADVKIEKVNDYKVNIKSLLGYDVVAYAELDGSITIYDQESNEVVVGGRKTYKWESVYDDDGNYVSGGYVLDMNNSGSTYKKLFDGIYELSDGFQYYTEKVYDDNWNTIYSHIKDGLLVKQGATLPGEEYTMLINSYENTGFDVELMQPIKTYYEDKDNINIEITDNTFKAYGVFGFSVITGTIGEDGSIVFDLDPDALYGSYETDENWNYTYYPLSLTPQSDGTTYMSEEADGFFLYSYFTNAYLANGADAEIANGIKSVETATSAKSSLDLNTPIYNIAGQRINGNAKGILIQNGKKYFVR